MRNTFLSFQPPLLGDEEIAEVTDTLRSDWITTGPKVKKFEQEFAAFVGAPAALAVSSATDAMLVGLAALGIGAGDAVITTPMTFCSTLHVIEHLGARPVLVDVEPDTLNIDPAQVEDVLKSAISNQRSAVGGRRSRRLCQSICTVTLAKWTRSPSLPRAITYIFLKMPRTPFRPNTKGE